MKNNLKLIQIYLISILLNYTLFACQSFGQLIPDANLPINTNIIQNSNNFLIEGGTQKGANLFHSLTRFDIPSQGTAYFNNTTTVENIFTRVTGGSVSIIDGILKANGNANLFLINPSGISFGANARLNIGGSFIVTSADSIKFSDGFEFSAIAPQRQSLLTVSVPVGLNFGSQPGGIRVEGTGHNFTALSRFAPIIRDDVSGLKLNPG